MALDIIVACGNVVNADPAYGLDGNLYYAIDSGYILCFDGVTKKKKYTQKLALPANMNIIDQYYASGSLILPTSTNNIVVFDIASRESRILSHNISPTAASYSAINGRLCAYYNGQFYIENTEEGSLDFVSAVGPTSGRFVDGTSPPKLFASTGDVYLVDEYGSFTLVDTLPSYDMYQPNVRDDFVYDYALGYVDEDHVVPITKFLPDVDARSVLKVGSRLFIMTVNGLIQSDDNGINYYRVSYDGFNNMRAATGNGTTLFINQNYSTVYSLDETRHKVVPAQNNSPQNINDIIFFDGMFYLTCINGVYATTDGGTYTLVPSTENLAWGTACIANGKLSIFGQGTVITKSPGQDFVITTGLTDSDGIPRKVIQTGAGTSVLGIAATYYTTDGETWTTISHYGNTQVYENGVWVIGGANINDSIKYSTDEGTTWTACTFDVYPLNITDAQLLSGNGIFVLYAYWTAYTSTDGMAFVRHGTPGFTLSTSVNPWLFEPARGVFIAAAYSGPRTGVYTSTDGATWTRQLYAVSSYVKNDTLCIIASDEALYIYDKNGTETRYDISTYPLLDSAVRIIVTGNKGYIFRPGYNIYVTDDFVTWALFDKPFYAVGSFNYSNIVSGTENTLFVDSSGITGVTIENSTMTPAQSYVLRKSDPYPVSQASQVGDELIVEYYSAGASIKDGDATRFVYPPGGYLGDHLNAYKNKEGQYLIGYARNFYHGDTLDTLSPIYTRSTVYDVIFFNGMFYASQDGAYLLESVDGVTWTTSGIAHEVNLNYLVASSDALAAQSNPLGYKGNIRFQGGVPPFIVDGLASAFDNVIAFLSEEDPYNSAQRIRCVHTANGTIDSVEDYPIQLDININDYRQAIKTVINADHVFGFFPSVNKVIHADRSAGTVSLIATTAFDNIVDTTTWVDMLLTGTTLYVVFSDGHVGFTTDLDNLAEWTQVKLAMPGEVKRFFLIDNVFYIACVNSTDKRVSFAYSSDAINWKIKSTNMVAPTNDINMATDGQGTYVFAAGQTLYTTKHATDMDAFMLDNLDRLFA